MKKKSFVVFNEEREYLKLMNDKQFREYWDIVFEYSETGNIKETSDPLVKMGVTVKLNEMSRSLQKYEESCQRKSNSMKKRWKQKSNSCEEDKAENNEDNKDNKNIKENKNTIEQVEDYKVVTDSDSECDRVRECDSECVSDRERECDSVCVCDSESDSDSDIIYFNSAKAEESPSEIKKQNNINNNSDNAYSKATNEVISMYNNICKDFPQINYSTNNRTDNIRKLIEKGYKKSDFQRVFEKVRDSSFLKYGRDGKWRACFDWIIIENNFVKILEGNYDNKTPVNSNNCYNNKQEEDYDLEKYRCLVNRF